MQGLGVVRLWLTEENDEDVVYREDTGTTAGFWAYDTESAIGAARSLLA